jgi:hypothetical protein
MKKLSPLRISFILCCCLSLLAAAPGVTVHMNAPDGAPASRHAAPAKPAPAVRNLVGEWGPVESLDDVPVHISLLPDGRLLYWGRDKDTSPSKWDVSGSSRSYTWHPITKVKMQFPNDTTNLFCSGHSYLPDGRLLVTGGHKVHPATPDVEAIGETAVNVFDYRNNTWRRVAEMPKGRWYPSNVTLANGETAIFSGKYWDNVTTARDVATGRDVPVTKLNMTPEIYTGQATLRQFSAQQSTPWYPYLYLAPNNRVFVPGPGNGNLLSSYFDPNANGGQGAFNNVDFLEDLHKEGSSVIYDPVAGKVLVVGGTANPPLSSAQTIDLTNDPNWHYVAPLNSGRKFHTATVLPDGKVLVTGGTRCAGQNDIGCPDGAAARPEMWDPKSPLVPWVEMAPNPSGIPRVYHSVAILLPDARVLVGGGGYPAASGEVVNGETCVEQEQPFFVSANCRTFGHKDAEIFSPPYLFDANGNPAPRPVINSTPSEIIHGQSFPVEMGNAAPVKFLVLVRLGSVTHGVTFDQRRVELGFTQSGSRLSVTAPAHGRLAPPGPYMLFALDEAGTPSVAKMVNVSLRPDAESHIARRSVRSNNRMQVFYRHLGDLKLRYMSAPAVTNLALNKPATQSSDLFGGVASRAVDGNTNGSYPQNSVTHTGFNAQAWWQVDIEASGHINTVRVWNRTDGGAERVANFYVLVSDVPFASTDLNATLAQHGVSAYHTAGVAGRPTSINVGRSGRYVRVQLVGSNWLNLAEVEVRGSSTAHSQTFSAPVELGGGLHSDPIAVENQDGRLQVFVRGRDGSLWCRAEDSAGSGIWADWQPLGVFTDLPRIAAARNLDGRLQLFYRGAGQALWYIAQTVPNSSTWTQPVSLGGGLNSDPAVGINADGRLQVFVRGTDNSLYHRWQAAPGSSDWSPWNWLGGGMSSGPYVAHHNDGRLDVFTRGSDGGVYHITQSTPNSSNAWAQWEALGGSVQGDHAYNAPAVSLTHDGRLQVFVRWSDNSVRTLIQSTPNGGFVANQWHNLGGTVDATLPPPTRGNDGLFYLFGRRPNDEFKLYVNRQVGLDFLKWSGYTHLGDSAHSF